MDKQERRRINPVARITLIAVLVLLVLEGLIIAGVLELQAQTVAKYAPWAYEPFLRLVGEHPESPPRQASIEEPDDEVADVPAAGVSGLESSAIPVLIETNASVLSTNLLPEATIPKETEPEPDPASVPANAPEDVQEEIVPVG